MPEKLLTIGEAAAILGISEEEIKRLAKKGELPAYQIGGEFLRFRREQIEAIRNEILTKLPAPEIKPKAKVAEDAIYEESISERLGDFFYFNDFYIISAALAALILLFILHKAG